MRRKIAAFLCAILCLTAFAGCSKEELGYLAMSADAVSTMKQSETTGRSEIYVDLDALKSVVAEVSLAAGTSQETVDEMMAQMADLTGKKTATLDYTVQMDLEELSYMFDLDLTYDGNIYSFGRMYYGLKDGVYVSTEALWSAYRLLCEFTEDDGSFLYDENFAEEWKAQLNAEKYVCVLDMNDLGLTQEELDAMLPDGGFDELAKAALDLYQNGFSGFTTGMVTEIPDGYRVEATGRECAQLLADLLQYVADHPTEVLDALTAYLEASFAYANAAEEDSAMVTDALASVKEDPSEMTDALLSAKAVVESVMADESYGVLLDGFSYTADTVKQGSDYAFKESYVFKDGNKTVFTLDSKGVMTAKPNGVVFPSQSVSLDEMTTKTTELVDKYNPVTGVTMTWYPADGSDEAILQKTRETTVAALAGSDLSFVNYVIEDGRAYLPLRDVCNALGLEVTWDAATRTASVMVDGTAVQMDSKLYDGVSYLAVRGFDALGYSVSYMNEDGMHMATLAK